MKIKVFDVVGHIDCMQQSLAAAQLAALHSNKNIELIVVDDMPAGMPFSKEKPYIIHSNREMDLLPTLKQFTCKGKHQYKRVVTNNLVEWVCQCGRKTTD